jgi:ATP-dependent 26S proteasome regulatory subunit
MYPFLSKDLFEYYDDYMDSSASVLVLLGPPGTGKTSFIRGLLQYTKTNALVSYDASILEKDYIFARFVEGQNNVMILEDADTFLGCRSDGNDVMHKFLNVGDGLITSKGKKMIFSTNLPSIKDIDPALVRPGRCFDVLEFRPMQETEHQALADKLGIDRMTGEKTLAEIFHSQIHAPKVKRRNMGFY